MRIKDFKREFKHLTLSRKAVFLGCLCAMLFSFFPWFEKAVGLGKNETIEITTGFSKFSIFGTVSLFFALISLLVLIREIITRNTKTFNFKNSVIWMFFAGEATFALIIAMFVFSSLFKDFSTAQFRFGIFLSIISHIIVFVGAHFAFLENRKESAKKDFQKISDEDLAKLNMEPEVSSEQLTLGDQ